MTESPWPPLPYLEWRETRDTLHMYTQIVGKMRLALSPFEPQWANVPLYVTARGLTTSPMPIGLRTLDAEFDFIDHSLILRTSDGGIEHRPLGGAVADFYQNVRKAMGRLRVDAALSVVPSEVADPIPFPDDHTHATYEPAHAARFFQVLSMVDLVVRRHRAGFRGRTTAVHFFWGTFDLALTRFSGRPITPPADAGVIARFGGDAEQICAGWWPGDERVPYPAFYAYAYPKPEGIERAAIRPEGAAWGSAEGEFILPYDVARSGEDPQQMILAFLTSTYAAAAALQNWSDDLTHVDAPASPSVPTSLPESAP